MLVCPTLIFSVSCSRHLPISAKQISRRCKHHESNSINKQARVFLPLERWGKLRSACCTRADTVVVPQCSAEIYQWLQASRRDGKSGTCKLPVIWQLKAIAGRAMGLEVIRGFRDLLWLRLQGARQLLERHINFQRQITIITAEFQNRKH